jgi:hypothetical protein
MATSQKSFLKVNETGIFFFNLFPQNILLLGENHAMDGRRAKKGPLLYCFMPPVVVGKYTKSMMFKECMDTQ